MRTAVAARWEHGASPPKRRRNSEVTASGDDLRLGVEDPGEARLAARRWRERKGAREHRSPAGDAAQWAISTALLAKLPRAGFVARGLLRQRAGRVRPGERRVAGAAARAVRCARGGDVRRRAGRRARSRARGRARRGAPRRDPPPSRERDGSSFTRMCWNCASSARPNDTGTPRGRPAFCKSSSEAFRGASRPSTTALRLELGLALADQAPRRLRADQIRARDGHVGFS